MNALAARSFLEGISLTTNTKSLKVDDTEDTATKEAPHPNSGGSHKHNAMGVFDLESMCWQPAADLKGIGRDRYWIM